MLAGQASVPHHLVHGPVVQAPEAHGPLPQPPGPPKGPAPPCQPPGPPVTPGPQAEPVALAYQLSHWDAAELRPDGTGCAEVTEAQPAESVGRVDSDASDVYDCHSLMTVESKLDQGPPGPPA